MKEWLKENAVILAGFGFLASTMFVMSNQLTRVETTGDNTAERVERIAKELPAMGIRLAHEEILKPIGFAIAATMPVQSPDGRWIRFYHFIEPASMTASSYTVPMESKDDLSLIYSLYGLAGAGAAAPDHASFTQLQDWSAIAERPTTMPGFIDAEHSLVVRRGNPAEYLIMLRSAQSRRVKYALHSKIMDWQSLSEELSSNSEIKEPE